MNSSNNLGTVSISCKKCGNNKLTIPDGKKGHDIVICSNCETELGSYSEIRSLLKKEAEKIAKNEIEKFRTSLKKSFANSKHIKFK